MDTFTEITVNSKNADEALDFSEELIFKLNNDLNKTSGIISQINSDGNGLLSGYAGKAIKAAYEFSEKTNGSFDLTIAPLIDLWGFYKKEYYVPQDDELKKALKNVDYKKISLYGDKIELNGTKIDIDGIAKGYATDVLVNELKNKNVNSALISLGGNIYALGANGSKPWKIGIANPKNPSEYIGTLEIENKAVVTSGSYQRNFTESNILYHHILDPSTGKNPTNKLSSVTVIGKSATECDALSTAFFVMGIEKACEYLSYAPNIGAIFINDDNTAYISSNLKNTFKESKNITSINFLCE